MIHSPGVTRMKTTHLLLAATALAALGACAKKPPAQLPPPPVEDGGRGGDYVAPAANSNGAVRPGSNEDFVRSVQSNTVNFAVDQYDIDPTARAMR